MHSADFWIQKLNLSPHPEGGFFKESYRASELIKKEHLPSRYSSDHAFSTAIYFLLKSGQISAFHRLRSDELWHFYYGSPLVIYQINPEGMLFEIRLGTDLQKGQIFQAHIRAKNWFAARVVNDDSYTLVGCTVAPGFEFEDFELAERSDLIRLFPRHAELIKQFTRE